MNKTQTHNKLLELLKSEGWTVVTSTSGSLQFLEPGTGKRWWTTNVIGAVQRQLQNERDNAIAEGKTDPTRQHPLQQHA